MRTTSPASAGAVLDGPGGVDGDGLGGLEPQLHVGEAVLEGLIGRQRRDRRTKRSNAYWTVKSKTRLVAPTISAHCSTSAVWSCARTTADAPPRTPTTAERRHPDVVEPDLGMSADQVEPAQRGDPQSGCRRPGRGTGSGPRARWRYQQPVGLRRRPRRGVFTPSRTNSSPSRSRLRVIPSGVIVRPGSATHQAAIDVAGQQALQDGVASSRAFA